MPSLYTIHRARAQPRAAVLVLVIEERFPDVLVVTDGLDAASSLAMKQKLKRIVSMQTRMVMKINGVAESQAEYNENLDYDYDHRLS